MVKTGVGVFNAPPVYASGLVGALEAMSCSVEIVSDLESWAEGNAEQTLLVMVHEPDDLDLVRNLRADTPETSIITILDPIGAEGVAASLRAGATGSIGLYSSPDEVILAIEAAEEGRIVLPTPMARSMMKTSLGDGDRRMLTKTDVTCLRALAAGEKVVDLAHHLGYSERETYRRLRRLYGRMGVGGRTEALLLAARWGVIE